MKVGDLAGGGGARIDHDDLEVGASFLGFYDALEQHGMAPSGVRAHQHDEIREFDVLIGYRHDVLAEGALVRGHGGGHAQARISVDVGRADIALHQLVRDVVVFGEELSGDVKGDRVGAVLGDDASKAIGHVPERGGPVGVMAEHAGVEQPTVHAERFAERRSFGAEPAQVGGVLGVAGDGDVRGMRCDPHAAAHAAVRAGGAYRRHGVHAPPRSVAALEVALLARGPNSSVSRSGPMLRASFISSAYHGPWTVSP